MHRISTKKEYYTTGKVRVDVDGIEVDLFPGIDEKLALMDAKIAEMNSIRAAINNTLSEVRAAKLTAFNGALTKSGDGAAFNTGDIYMNVLTGEVFEK